MRRFLLIAALLFVSLDRPAMAARQVAVLIPLAVSGDNAASLQKGAIDRAVIEKLSDRFDIRVLAAGAPYILDGSVIRIGRSVSFELRIRTSEPGAIGKTVVATVRDESDSTGAQGEGLPPVYRRLITEATANLKLRFFGDDRNGNGSRIPGLAGKMTRSAAFPGTPVSAAVGDTDRDGKRELIVAFPSEILIYRIDGDDLVEKRRIVGAGSGIIRVETADLDQNGMSEIIVIRFADGKPASDIWTFDGKDYRKFVSNLPWFVGLAKSEKEGVVLLGQETEDQSQTGGPLFRLAFNRYGQGEIPDKAGAVPLPPGTGLFDVTRLSSGKGSRFAVIGKDGVPALFDLEGKRLSTASEPIRGLARALAVDLNNDGTEELLAVNNLITPGVFFESVKVQSGAELLAFAQDGETLRLAWRTPQIGFGVLDAFLLNDDVAHTRRIGLLVRDKGKLLEGQAEWRIVWYR